MAIDECPHSFRRLTSVVLPGYMRKLRRAMQKPHRAVEFSRPGAGPATIARAFNREGDFSGCYVLMKGKSPKYVGISRSVLNRLRQHVTGKDHFGASLVFAITKRKLKAEGHRDVLMKRRIFRAEFRRSQAYLRRLDVAFVEIDNPVVLHLFEVYAAIKLDTSKWNTFRTH